MCRNFFKKWKFIREKIVPNKGEYLDKNDVRKGPPFTKWIYGF